MLFAIVTTRALLFENSSSCNAVWVCSREFNMLGAIGGRFSGSGVLGEFMFRRVWRFRGLGSKVFEI